MPRKVGRPKGSKTKKRSGSKTSRKRSGSKVRTVRSTSKRRSVKRGYGRRTGKRLYFGVGSVPKGKTRGSANSALRHKQVRYYGEVRIPHDVLVNYIQTHPRTRVRVHSRR